MKNKRESIYLLALIGNFLMVNTCVPPEPRMKFSDYAKRSPVVLRARALSLTPSLFINNNYDVTFQVLGAFPKRRGGVLDGSNITLGSFGRGTNCKEVKLNTNHILFLRPSRTRGKVTYQMRYNPIPLSATTARFFTNVLTDTYSGKTILRSGCPKLDIPKNGRVLCTQNKIRCRVICNTGYKLVGKDRFKTCYMRLMTWFPSTKFVCKQNKIKQSTSSKNVALSDPKALARLWSLADKSSGNFLDFEEEEEEEEIFPRFNRRNRKPPPKKFLKKNLKKKVLKLENISRKPEKIDKLKTKSHLKITKQKSPESKVVNQTVDVAASKINSNTLNFIKKLPNALTPTSPLINPSLNNNDLALKKPTPSDSTSQPFITFFQSSNNSVFDEMSDHEIAAPPRGDSWVAEDGSINTPLSGFQSTILGCPTYEGNIMINSVWRGGFDGTTQFDSIANPLLGGWVVRIMFNFPVESLETFVVDPFTASASFREFVLVPKHYNRNLYQELTVSFLGRSRSLISGAERLVSKAYLLGVCNNETIKDRRVGKFLPFDDRSGNVSAAWLATIPHSSFVEPNPNVDNSNIQATQATSSVQELTLPLSIVTTTTSTQSTHSIENNVNARCRLDSPNSFLPEGGVTQPDWLPSNTTSIDYNEILHKSILFYEAQRSGKLLPGNRIPWRGDADLKDGCPNNVDLTGGWYNSGGNVKTTTLTAFSSTMLAWGAIDYEEAYQTAGELENLLSLVRWATDYLMKTHITRNQIVVQVGDFMSADQGWNPPEDSDPHTRTIHVANSTHPAADVACDVAAALASASILFNSTDSDYSSVCLQHAIQLYSFATQFPIEYQSPIRQIQWSNPRNGVNDDLAWASTWIYRATGNDSYLQQAQERFLLSDQSKNLFYWGDKRMGTAVLLWKFSSSPTLYRLTTESYLSWLMQGRHFTPSGLLWLYRPGTTMYAANSAFLCLQALNLVSDSNLALGYYNFALHQLRLIIGERGQSYVVGVGPNSPTKPHHRGSSCPSPPEFCPLEVLTSELANHHVLYGALVSGPDKNGMFSDETGSYFDTNVAITYNAGFQSLVAGLKQLSTRDW